ncbi:MAG: hypothetical protein A3G83_00760 [Betaproteobacteria bacterium RIFCSPLOWO2_12_FULL_68_20]|nr:MAG: hypothetical protein A3G83_00760 [Betaproteobacteria bacterium RIFCSPLOWO2_12_FULL_68_20]
MTREVRARGFSLVELVVTIIIAGILAAIVIPQFNIGQFESGWFYEQVKAAVRYAQRQAVAQRRTTYVEVQASQLRLCYDAGCTTRLTQLTGQEYVLSAPDGVTLSPVGTFSFNGLGQSAGATIAVGGQSITVNAETGYVQ